MTRILAICCVLCAAAVLVHADLVTYYEDHFDGSALDPAWTAWGSGSYDVSGSNLSFTTEPGDFHNNYEPYYGVPEHVFLVQPPSHATVWTAVTRIRYNTPDQSFEQVDLMAFVDHNNNARLAYDYGGTARYHVMLSEESGAISQTSYATAAHSDYFWLRLERDGKTYTGSMSNDSTTNPDLVSWTALGSTTNLMSNPMVGIGGWNAADMGGELAEFDYFRLQIIPEPSMLAAVSTMFLVFRSARRRAL